MDSPNGAQPAGLPAQFSGHLELLSVMSQRFAASLDIQETIQTALQLITQYVNAEGGALFLLEDDGHQLVCRASVGPVDIRGVALGSDQGIVGHSVSHNEGVIVRDVRNDPNFQQAVDQATGFTTRSILCAPMSVKDSHLGAIELVNKCSEDSLFSEADLMMLQTLASAAAMALINARMSKALVEQEKTRRELELAAKIQRSLLPAPRPAPFPVYGVNVPARMVSGDFYDFYELPDGRIYFSLGDVSGKGMNAALMMSKTSSLFRCLGKNVHEPGRLVAMINAEICDTASRGMFVTMVAGVYDPRSGRVVMTNAGHEPPMFIARDGSVHAFPAELPPLGIVPAPEVMPELELDLDGGRLYVFTDGVTEGLTADGSPLGRDGFERIVREHAAVPAEGRIGRVLEALPGDTLGHLHDDITVLVIEDGAE